MKVKIYFTHVFFSLLSKNVHEKILFGFLSRVRQSSKFHIRNTPKIQLCFESTSPESCSTNS